MKALRADYAVAGIVLIPFLTVGLEFRTSLIAQAIGILVIVLLLLPALAGDRGRRRVFDAPRSVILGLAVFTLVTLGGAALGLLRSYSPAAIAGQTLSMALLPLAAVAGLAAWPSLPTGLWQSGLLKALSLGCWIQLSWGLVRVLGFGEPTRLFLPNAVSVIGPALLGLNFALVSLRHSNPRLRRLAWLAALSLLLVILASSLRSLWILTPFTVFAILVASRGFRSREALVMAAIILFLVSGAVAAVLGLQAWLAGDRPDLLHREPCTLFPAAGRCVDGSLELELQDSRDFRFDAPVNLPDADAWRIMVRGRGEGSGVVVIALLFLDDQGRVLQRVAVPLTAEEQRDLHFSLGSSPPAWSETRIRLSPWKHPEGRWRIEEIQCAAIESPILLRLATETRAIQERMLDLVTALGTGSLDRDSTLGFRWHESRKIIKAVKASSWDKRLFGHGLGASVRLDMDGFDNRGHWIHYGDVNYIHNWYLFLVYKLGIVGSILILGVLIAWILWTIQVLRGTSDAEARAFLTAAAASWIVYAIWSLTSPEILDFRMAPLWGWLLSASVVMAGRGPVSGAEE